MFNIQVVARLPLAMAGTNFKHRQDGHRWQMMPSCGLGTASPSLVGSQELGPISTNVHDRVGGDFATAAPSRINPKNPHSGILKRLPSKSCDQHGRAETYYVLGNCQAYEYQSRGREGSIGPARKPSAGIILARLAPPSEIALTAPQLPEKMTGRARTAGAVAFIWDHALSIHGRTRKSM